MQVDSFRLARVRREAYEGVLRAVNAPLDSVQLRAEITARVRHALPADSIALGTSDPELGLLTHGLYWDYPEPALRHFYTEIYPREAAVKFIDMARNGELATTHSGPLETEFMHSYGFGSKMLVVFPDRGMLWGVWCLARSHGTRPFDEEEEAFARLLAPHIAAGLRRAALLEVARDAALSDAADAPGVPGVALYDARGHLVLHDGRVERYLADVADPPGTRDGARAMPAVVAGALTQLRWRLRLPAGAPAEPQDAGIHVRGQSGQWYTVHASAAEAVDASQAGQALIVIAPMAGGERAGVLARLYGLTPREREVIVRTARGEPAKQIAAALGLSWHTVQAHINNACAKVGARGRKELVAKLFFDGAAARLAS
jgi:DNA-binding CsgD family transcriptional regulator